MKKKTTPKTTPKRMGVPRPMLAMATPPNDRPTVTIDRLKGGEVNWSIRATADRLALAIDRALAEADRVMEGCLRLEEREKTWRAALAQEKAERAAKREAEAKERAEAKAEAEEPGQ